MSIVIIFLILITKSILLIKIISQFLIIYLILIDIVNVLSNKCKIIVLLFIIYID